MKSLFTIETFCLECTCERNDYEWLKWLLEYNHKWYKEWWKDESIICIKYES